MSTAKILKTLSPREFMRDQGFSNFHGVIRENNNKFPYVTFIKAGAGPNGENLAENVYYSKNLSNEVAEGMEVVPSLKGRKISLIEFSDGRPTRWKITSGESNWGSAEDLD